MAATAGVNSFVDVTEADAYFAAHLKSETWADVEDKDSALITAFQRLDQERYKSDLDFTDSDGALVVDADLVPDRMKRAQYKLALIMAGSDLLTDTGLEGFASVQIGPLSIVPKARVAGLLPADVRREIAPYLYGGGGIRLYR
jgi:hypothetical protein